MYNDRWMILLTINPLLYQLNRITCLIFLRSAIRKRVCYPRLIFRFLQLILNLTASNAPLTQLIFIYYFKWILWCCDHSPSTVRFYFIFVNSSHKVFFSAFFKFVGGKSISCNITFTIDQPFKVRKRVHLPIFALAISRSILIFFPVCMPVVYNKCIRSSI